MQEKPPYMFAGLAGGLVMLLYVITLAPTTAFWDASEYIATAHILGIPHPPGNPLFVALGKTWSTLLGVFGPPVAVRINLFAAATSAATAGFWFLVAHRILIHLRPKAPTLALIGAGASTLISATAFTVWHQSTVNEKVYTVSMMIMAAVTWLLVIWYEKRDEEDSLKYLVLAVYLMLLGSTNHLMSMLPMPALGILVLLAAPGVLLKPKLWASVVPVALLAISFNFFLPIRAAQDPIINEGEPACESLADAVLPVFTNGKVEGATVARSPPT